MNAVASQVVPDAQLDFSLEGGCELRIKIAPPTVTAVLHQKSRIRPLCYSGANASGDVHGVKLDLTAFMDPVIWVGSAGFSLKGADIAALIAEFEKRGFPIEYHRKEGCAPMMPAAAIAAPLPPTAPLNLDIVDQGRRLLVANNEHLAGQMGAIDLAEIALGFEAALDDAANGSAGVTPLDLLRLASAECKRFDQLADTGSLAMFDSAAMVRELVNEAGDRLGLQLVADGAFIGRVDPAAEQLDPNSAAYNDWIFQHMEALRTEFIGSGRPNSEASTFLRERYLESRR